MDLSAISGYLLDRLFKNPINRIILGAVNGFFAQLLNDVRCNKLDLEEMEIKDPVDTESNQTIMIEELTLDAVGGNVNSLFDNIEHCHKLTLMNIDESFLSNLNITSIVTDKVNTFDFVSSSLVPFPLTKWFSEYDGKGKCEEIEIHRLGFISDDSISWVNARGWEVSTTFSGALLYRPK